MNVVLFLLICLSSLTLIYAQESLEVSSNGRTIQQSDRILEILKDFSNAWNAHDLDRLMSFMSNDCEFYSVGGSELLGKSWIGPEQVREGFSQAFITFPDAQWLDPVHFVAATDETSPSSPRAITESTFVGTRTTAEGEKLRTEARMVDVFTFNEFGKIRIKNAFRKDRAPIKVV